jgi:hypothetical protein
MAVTNCNIDMESLITDQNRSIATLAITTLLKTGAGLRACMHGYVQLSMCRSLYARVDVCCKRLRVTPAITTLLKTGAMRQCMCGQLSV